MSEFATEKHLIDPDKWLLPEDEDVVWLTEEKLKEMSLELLKAMRENLEKKLMENVHLSVR